MCKILKQTVLAPSTFMLILTLSHQAHLALTSRDAILAALIQVACLPDLQDNYTPCIPIKTHSFRLIPSNLGFKHTIMAFQTCTTTILKLYSFVAFSICYFNISLVFLTHFLNINQTSPIYGTYSKHFEYRHPIKQLY